MALQFPTNPSTGETYQSGASATYTYNGRYWVVTIPKTSIAVSVVSASWGDQRSNVTWIQPNGLGDTLFIAEGKLYAIKGNSTGHNNYTAAPGVLASGSLAANKNIGVNRAYLVDFTNETGSYNVVSASAYGHTALALLDNGNLYGWGLNQSGQLGLGVTNPIFEPAYITTGVTNIYRSPSQGADEDIYTKVLIKKTDGFIYGAGYNARGGLGLGSATASTVSAFSRIDGLGQDPLFVENYGSYNGGIFAQKADGTVVACGYNQNGWIGDGSTTQRNSFVTVSAWLGGDTTAKIRKALGSNRYHDGSAFVESAGLSVWISGSSGQKIMFAGDGKFGHAGIGPTASANITTPTAATLFTSTSTFTNVYTSGAPYTLYVLTGSTVYGWGYNNYGQLITQTSKNPGGGFSSPTVVLTDVTEVLGDNVMAVNNSILSRSPLFKKTDGRYYWSGVGSSGQLGVGENITTDQSSSPLGAQRLRLPIGESLKYVGAINTDAGNSAYIGITPDDRFYTWGRNSVTRQIDAVTTTEFFEPQLITPQVLFK